MDEKHYGKDLDESEKHVQTVLEKNDEGNGLPCHKESFALWNRSASPLIRSRCDVSFSAETHCLVVNAN
jgi:hypothetical protein